MHFLKSVRLLDFFKESPIVKYKRWISKEPHTKKEIFAIVLNLVILDLLLSFASILFMRYTLGIEVSERGTITDIYVWYFPFLMIFVFFYEEFIFRFIPACVISRNSGLGGKIFAGLISSLLFGYLHGGWTHVPLQGIGGFMYYSLFLKAGGLNNKMGQSTAGCNAGACNIRYNLHHSDNNRWWHSHLRNSWTFRLAT